MSAQSPAKRLPDGVVRSIFECLHEGKPPPDNVDFKIIRAGVGCQRLSPPGHPYPNGLYVLLKPPKKSKKKEGPDELVDPPPNLQHLLVEFQDDSCPWSLSGPQFPKPTAIQQRYCYPTGNSEYSKNKGGSLWTMYDKEGKEDSEFRLLHVYFSQKRSVNKAGGSPNKRPRRSPKKSPRTPNPLPRSLSPPSTHSSMLDSPVLRSPPQLRLSFSPPVISSPDVNSPLSTFTEFFDPFVVTPTNDIGLSPPHPDDDMSSMACASLADERFSPSPFRVPYRSANQYTNIEDSPLLRTGNFANEILNDLGDPLDYRMDVGMPYFDVGAEDLQSFKTRLDNVSTHVTSKILAAPPYDQPRFASEVSNWARNLADSPLVGDLGESYKSGSEQQQEDVTQEATI